MIYTRGAFEKSENAVSARRMKAEDECAQRMAEIRFNAPEIYALQRSLSSSNFELINLIGKGKSDLNAKAEIEKIRRKNVDTQKTIREMLRAFGYPEDYLQYHYYCPVCNDTGYHDGIAVSTMKNCL